MGACGMEKIHDASPEGRARKYEGALHLDCYNSDHFKSAFFSLYGKDFGTISASSFQKGWALFRKKGIVLEMGGSEDDETHLEAFARF